MYNKFSDIYDLLTFDIDYKKYSQNIMGLLKKDNIEQGNLLEIGCGSGNLTSHLASENFNILAFDYSEQMLNNAYTKLIDFENVSLIKADMYKFPYEMYEFDAVVTLLDVINYILKKDKVRDLFAGVYEGLKKDGLFIFDLNSESRMFERLGNNTYVYEKDHVFYTWENERKGDLVNFYLNFFVKDEKGKYERIIENQVEKYYSLEDIIEILEEVGFCEIEYFDEDTMDNPTKDSQRILIKCKK